MTAPPPARTLWRDEAGGRFYVVPADADLAAGPLLLRSGATRSLSVDPSAVAPYEVSREEGRAFLDAQVEAWAARTKQELAGAFSGPGGSADAPGDAPPADPASGPGVALFSALTGQPAQSVAGDPDAFVRGLATLLGEAASALRRAGEGPEGEAEARARIRQLGDTLRAHGIAAPSPPPGEPD